METRFVLISVALFLAGCGSKKPTEQPPQAVQIQQLKATSSVGSGWVRYSAFVAPDSQVLLAFRIPGYVTSLMQVRGSDGKLRDIAEGDRVSQGARLVCLREAEYQDKVREAASQAEAAEAAAQKAQLDYDRAQHLFDAESITKTDFDGARAQYDATQAELRSAHALISEAQIALHDTALIAPFSGDIIKKAVEVGSFVGPGIPAVVLAKTDKLKIIFGVPDTTVRSLKLGQPVSVAVDAVPNRTFNARITRIAAAADPKTRTFDVEVAIPNSGHLLKAGMIASLQLGTSDRKNQQASVLVPLSAIAQGKDGKYGVFVVSATDAGNVARLRAVDVGTVEGSQIQIVNGLKLGDTIVTTGATLLTDGQRVEVVQ